LRAASTAPPVRAETARGTAPAASAAKGAAEKASATALRPESPPRGAIQADSARRGRTDSPVEDEKTRASRQQEGKADIAAFWVAAEAAARYRAQGTVQQAKTLNDAPKEQGPKQVEARSEPTLKVIDLRKQASARRAGSAAAGPEEARLNQGRELSKDEAVAGKETVRELGLDLARGQKTLDMDSIQPKAEPAPAGASDFSTLLAERLRESWNGEIVKSAQIILKDGDSGQIRLRLRPESLGGVKIELNLSDNNISGRIVVESDEARSAFERSLGDLADAFRAGGFESASLEVSVGSGGGTGSERGASPFYSERSQEETEREAEIVRDRRRSLVDILA
jgi:flagellar hook-length control protein FliK